MIHRFIAPIYCFTKYETRLAAHRHTDLRLSSVVIQYKQMSCRFTRNIGCHVKSFHCTFLTALLWDLFYRTGIVMLHYVFQTHNTSSPFAS